MVADSKQTKGHSPEDQQQSLTLLRSSIRSGNSDPFDSQSIPIGPHESDLLKIYREIVVLSLGKASWWKVKKLEVVQAMCLSDKAAAFALLARNSAIQDARSRGHGEGPSTVQLKYLAQAQAALRKNISLMVGPIALSMITQVLWTTLYLAYAEMINESPTAGVHMRPMSQLVVRYAELMGDQVNKADIIAVTIVDIVRACKYLTRPTLDMVCWFPGIFRTLWDETGVCRSGQGSKEAALRALSRDVKDKRLQTVVLDLREEQEMHHTLLEGAIGLEEGSRCGFSIHSRQLFQQAQLLHIVLDAMERLGTSRLSELEVQDQMVRAYLSLSVLLWLLVTSPISLTAERVLNGTGRILEHVRNILMKEPSDAARYQKARLWALCIGVHTELHRKGLLGSDLACDRWFFEAFVNEVKSMRISRWEQVSSISEQFLCLDRFRPHISQWWYQIVPDHCLEEREPCSSAPA